MHLFRLILTFLIGDLRQEFETRAGEGTRGDQAHSKRASCDWTVYGSH